MTGIAAWDKGTEMSYSLTQVLGLWDGGRQKGHSLEEEGEISLGQCGVFVNTEGGWPSSGSVSGVSVWCPGGGISGRLDTGAGPHDGRLNLRRDLGRRQFRGWSCIHGVPSNAKPGDLQTRLLVELLRVCCKLHAVLGLLCRTHCSQHMF